MAAPRSRAARLGIAAGAALLLAAGVAVAVAVPVRAARAGAVSGRELRATDAAAAALAAAAQPQQVPGSAPTCQGVRGLCDAPVRLVTFPGTHNSNAIKTNFANLAESQKLSFLQQLEAGARLFDLDYAGGRNGPRFGHCLSCLCAFASDPDEADPRKVFATMARWLAAHPRELIVVGLSNIPCGDKAAARQELLGMLAESPLAALLATRVVGPSTTLGELVDANQRVVLLFYDEWTSASSYQIGSKAVPNQPLFRIYGGGTTITNDSPAGIDRQVATRLLADMVQQLSAPQPALGVNTPWRVISLQPSNCLVCRTSDTCGAGSCAVKAGAASYVLYVLAKATSRWTRGRSDQSQLVPAFNGFQVDYLQAAPASNVVAAATRLNEAAAWAWSVKRDSAAKLGLGNCVWVFDDDEAAGDIACVQHGRLSIQALLGLPAGGGSGTASGRRLAEAEAALVQQAAAADEPTEPGGGGGGAAKRRILVPANPALLLRVAAGGTTRREVRGIAGKAQLLDLSPSAETIAVLWQ